MSKKKTTLRKILSKDIENFNDKLSDDGHCDISEYKECFLKYFNTLLKGYYEDFEGYFSDSDSDSSSGEKSDSDSDSSSGEKSDSDSDSSSGEKSDNDSDSSSGEKSDNDSDSSSGEKSDNENEITIKTMRYLGNKTELLDFIYDTLTDFIDKYKLKPEIFDGFGGTGSVTQYFNFKKFKVISNDMNDYSYKLCYSRNCITKEDITFNLMDSNIDEVLKFLNERKYKGFIYKNYSPDPDLKYERKYFTNDNAERIDGIRIQIDEWYNNNKITEKEFIHLVSLLIETTSLYSNIPGTYGAFLKNWDSRALKKLCLTKNVSDNLLARCSDGNQTYNDDIVSLIKKVDSDILYIDPPYNERDYSMYYHVLETISKYDDPKIKPNKTGTKTRYNKSKWCSKKTAFGELESIIKNSKSKLIVMSYNNEGIIPMKDIKSLFESCGTYTSKRKLVKRFKCRKENKNVAVYEYLHILKKDEAPILENIIYNECCLLGMTKIPDNYVDLICTDLPYGLTECKWDTPLDLDILWKQYNRVLREYGTIILFGKQPFTSRLVASNYKMFKYSLVWHKSKPGGFAQAPYKVLCEHEDILVFSYGKTTKNSNRRMIYNPQGTKPCNKNMKGKTGNTAHRKGRKTQADYVQTVTNYPRSILNFNNEGKVKHPTQKPLDLLEYLVKTFSNEGDIVLDNCMGSGTTAVACLNTNRKYIGFEKEEKYYKVCMERIKNN
jgi:adenine-specific DNA methylase/DNA modification methylase